MPDWTQLSFVTASQPRFRILVLLRDKALTPTQLADKLNLPIPRVSGVLKELADEELVVCHTPDSRKSRLYGITQNGKRVLSEIHELTEVRANGSAKSQG